MKKNHSKTACNTYWGGSNIVKQVLDTSHLEISASCGRKFQCKCFDGTGKYENCEKELSWTWVVDGEEERKEGKIMHLLCIKQPKHS